MRSDCHDVIGAVMGLFFKYYEKMAVIQTEESRPGLSEGLKRCHFYQFDFCVPKAGYQDSLMGIGCLNGKDFFFFIFAVSLKLFFTRDPENGLPALLQLSDFSFSPNLLVSFLFHEGTSVGT